MSELRTTPRRRVHTVAEVAEILAESTDTISLLCRTQRLKGAYKGGNGLRNSPWRIPPAAIDYYQNTQPRS